MSCHFVIALFSSSLSPLPSSRNLEDSLLAALALTFSITSPGSPLSRAVASSSSFISLLLSLVLGAKRARPSCQLLACRLLGNVFLSINSLDALEHVVIPSTHLDHMGVNAGSVITCLIQFVGMSFSSASLGLFPSSYLPLFYSSFLDVQHA